MDEVLWRIFREQYTKEGGERDKEKSENKVCNNFCIDISDKNETVKGKRGQPKTGSVGEFTDNSSRSYCG